MSCTWDFCALHYDIPARKGSIFHRKATCFHQMWWHTEHCIASPASEVVSEKKDQSEVRPGCKWFGRSPWIRGWAAGDKVSGLTWKANKGLQQLQPNGSFASSAEQGRPVSSTFWVTLRVHVVSWSYMQTLPRHCTECSLVPSSSTSSPFSLGTTDSWFYLCASVTRAKHQSVGLFPDVKVIKQVAYCCKL